MENYVKIKFIKDKECECVETSYLNARIGNELYSIEFGDQFTCEETEEAGQLVLIVNATVQAFEKLAFEKIFDPIQLDIELKNINYNVFLPIKEIEIFIDNNKYLVEQKIIEKYNKNKEIVMSKRIIANGEVQHTQEIEKFLKGNVTIILMGQEEDQLIVKALDKPRLIDSDKNMYFLVKLSQSEIAKLNKTMAVLNLSKGVFSESKALELIGEVEILCDLDSKQRFWKKSDRIQYLLKGLKDPKCCVLKFNEKTISYLEKGINDTYVLDENIKYN